MTGAFENRTLAKLRAGSGVACGLFTATAEAARERLEQGFVFVVATDDIRLARGGIASALDASKQGTP